MNSAIWRRANYYVQASRASTPSIPFRASSPLSICPHPEQTQRARGFCIPLRRRKCAKTLVVAEITNREPVRLFSLPGAFSPVAAGYSSSPSYRASIHLEKVSILRRLVRRQIFPFPLRPAADQPRCVAPPPTLPRDRLAIPDMLPRERHVTSPRFIADNSRVSSLINRPTVYPDDIVERTVSFYRRGSTVRSTPIAAALLGLSGDYRYAASRVPRG